MRINLASGRVKVSGAICWVLNWRRRFWDEPFQHLVLVHGHPVHVGLGSLQWLLKSRAACAQWPCIVFFELHQLERNERETGYFDSLLQTSTILKKYKQCKYNAVIKPVGLLHLNFKDKNDPVFPLQDHFLNSRLWPGLSGPPILSSVKLICNKNYTFVSFSNMEKQVSAAQFDSARSKVLVETALNCDWSVL